MRPQVLEDLYNLSDAMRQQIEAYCFQDLEVNMIRFFVYHDLEVPNDNSNAFNLDTSQLDWTRYNSCLLYTSPSPRD